MDIKMDKWQSEWVSDDHSNIEVITPDFARLYSSCNSFEDNNDSPNVSRDDSIESYGDDGAERNDAILKPTFKSVLQAKKRLQAFSAVKQLKKSVSREEKYDESDKPDKSLSKKQKKALYPDDKAKAVIKEIEEIKRMEQRGGVSDDLPKPASVPPEILATASAAIKSISLKAVIRSRSRSSSLEREHFKRREIKSRNYRRKSISPEDFGRRKSPTKKLAYPKSWTEYKYQNLTLVKDEELKSKLFPKQKYSQHELVTRIFNFDSPSPLLESFKYSTVEDKTENVPVSFMRVTRAKPSIVYSVNFENNKEAFISRKQLFGIIPRERREVIERFISTPSSKAQPSAKKLQSRQWYGKTWKNPDAICKILENSVGLSFLQNYSDEEEENETEEIVICSSTKENGVKDVAPTPKPVGKQAPQTRAKPQSEKCEKPELPNEKLEKTKTRIEKHEKPEVRLEDVERDEVIICKKIEKKSCQEDLVAKEDYQLSRRLPTEERSPPGLPSKKTDRNVPLDQKDDKIEPFYV
ncbi:hypothetical protein NQ318_009132 [Aromia moschata]|uniref:Uncharacterized protein n=1 Tax=Aromia moschata TaxID=1265417 RepID=A0AAV8XIF3_9CUCU|nr:hypothetical protein NQ318_009132 [Aromia moschata]